ncbi:MAG: hypothetical protein NZ520_11905, partial [bacterium]|nr:hypothetical protein [bacterium]
RFFAPLRMTGELEDEAPAEPCPVSRRRRISGSENETLRYAQKGSALVATERDHAKSSGGMRSDGSDRMTWAH